MQRKIQQLTLWPSNMVQDVYQFNKEIIKTEERESPGVLSRERLLFALTAMYEELHEFTVANNTDNVGEALDAMIDLIYFALGRCYELGITEKQFYDCWNIVQEKNMQKSLGRKNRGTQTDAVKPEGWEAADLNEVLR